MRLGARSFCSIGLGLLMGASVGNAQVPERHVTVGVRPLLTENTCEEIGPKCSLPSSADSTGNYEFVFYLPRYWGMTDSVQLSYDWPESWTFLSWESCNAELTSGDPSSPGSLLQFYAMCGDEAPFLRVQMACPTPGRFRALPPISAIGCYWPLEWERSGYESKTYVEIGDYCGRNPQGGGCSFCARSLAAHFDPPSNSFTLERGTQVTDTLRASGFSNFCPVIPECDQNPPPVCFGGLQEDIPWLEYTLLSDSDYERVYLITVDATDLVPGTYEDRVYANPVCSACVRNCMDVTLDVFLDPSSVPDSELDRSTRGSLRVTPNPTSERTTISFSLAKDSGASCAVFDASGRRIWSVPVSTLREGEHRIEWDLSTDDGGVASSGVYFVRLLVDGNISRERVVLVQK